MKAIPPTRYLLVALVLVTAASLVKAQFLWTKDSRNPAFSGGGDAAWDAHVFMPMVLYNSDSSRYEMWYAGSNLLFTLPYRFGFATSPDGINWTKYGPPLMSADAGTWEETRLQYPTVIRENGKYKMWYGGYRGSIGGIGYATSPDGIHWSKHPGNPVLGPTTMAWEVRGPFFCDVLPLPGGGYKMWYSAGEASQTNALRIGTATSADGIAWQRDTVNNPVLSPSGWEGSYLWGPRVLRIGSTYYMCYTGGSGDQRRIGMASSIDGKSWKKSESNPVVGPSPAGWDNRSVESASLMQQGNTLVMWYDGSTTLSPSYWKIGRATSILPIGARDWEWEVPREFDLAQNYPNPFNPSTVIRYQLPVASSVNLVVYDLLGREVATLVNERKAAGSYEVNFDAAGLASGVYLYRLHAGSFVQSRKMVLTK